jgi:hypothetical protein
MLGLLVVLTALVMGRAGADEPSPSPQASATLSASPTPRGRPRIFETGRQFVSIGFAPERIVTSEFAPTSVGARPGWDLWQTGEQKIEGISFISTNDYREIPYPHLASNPVTTIGGEGSTIVPSFQVHSWALENDAGVRVAAHVFAGLAYINIKQNTGYPPLHGVGYAIVLAPNAAAPRTSPYGWISYFPNVGGNYTLADLLQTGLSYRALRYRAGALIRSPGTPIALDLGLDGETMTNRTNAPATISDIAFRLGLAIRF